MANRCYALRNPLFSSLGQLLYKTIIAATVLCDWLTETRVERHLRSSSHPSIIRQSSSSSSMTVEEPYLFERETEILGFTPLSFIDQVVNVVNESAHRTILQLQQTIDLDEEMNSALSTDEAEQASENRALRIAQF
jgi:hypothetical protein